MTFDLIAAWGCVIIACCAFALHAVSGPAFKSWITLPGSIRLGIVAVGVLFWLQSVKLMSFVSDPVVETPGHIDLLGVAGCLAFAFLAAACLYHVVRLRLGAKGWDRLLWATSQMHQTPNLHPTLLTDRDLERAAQGLGVTVNTNLGARPQP